MMHRDPDDPDRTLMLLAKMNIAARQSGLAFRIVDGKLEWEKEPVDITADDLLAQESEPAPRAKELERAKSFLRDLLARGPVAATDVLERGKQAGLSQRTLKRAKDDLGVDSKKSGDVNDRRWFWRLPSSVPASTEEDRALDLGTDGPLGPLPEPSNVPEELDWLADEDFDDSWMDQE